MQILFIAENIEEYKDYIKALFAEHYLVDFVHQSSEVSAYIQSDIYDFILLDTNLCSIDIIALLKNIRQDNIITPIILLEAELTPDNIINALNAGADDCIIPTISPQELVARIRAISRRNTIYRGDIIGYKDLSYNKGTMELSCQNTSFRLSLKEAKLIEILLISPTQVIPKTMFIDKIWGVESNANYNNVEVYVSFLRQKISLLNTNVKIRTIRGVGYQLV